MVRKLVLGVVVAAAFAFSPPSAHAQGYNGPFFGIGNPIVFTEMNGSLGTPFHAAVARVANVFGTSTAPGVPVRTFANTDRLFGNLAAAGFAPTSPARWPRFFQ